MDLDSSDVELKLAANLETPQRTNELLVLGKPRGRHTPHIDSAVTEWIVPLLVKEFLRERKTYDTEVKTADLNIEPLGKEGAAINRIP
jgi:hypothetical protein